jgi:hypothetical protein
VPGKASRILLVEDEPQIASALAAELDHSGAFREALLGGAGWARWFAIVVGCLNFIVQLGFVGSVRYPLWTLAGSALTAIVLHALIVRWEDRETA